MITIEQLNEAMETICFDNELILIPDKYLYSDLLDSHRYILKYFDLSFNIGELKESDDDSTTIIYTWSNENNIIVFQEGLKDFKSLEDYCDWLNEMESKALHVNK